jgi:hypothetical protein
MAFRRASDAYSLNPRPGRNGEAVIPVTSRLSLPPREPNRSRNLMK